MNDDTGGGNTPTYEELVSLVRDGDDNEAHGKLKKGEAACLAQTYYGERSLEKLARDASVKPGTLRKYRWYVGKLHNSFGAEQIRPGEYSGARQLLEDNVHMTITHLEIIASYPEDDHQRVLDAIKELSTGQAEQWKAVDAGKPEKVTHKAEIDPLEAALLFDDFTPDEWDELQAHVVLTASRTPKENRR